MLAATKLRVLGALVAALVLPSLAHANATLDRQYLVESVGVLRAVDNVDGLFADYVWSGAREYFNQQTRLVYVDLSRFDAVLQKSKVPLTKAVQDPAILSQIARTARTSTLIRTRITKEGPEYRFALEWLQMPQAEILATESFVLRDQADGAKFGISDVPTAIEQSLGRLFAKVPFVGAVTGRDDDKVTINLGARAGVEKGDILVIGSIDEAKKHPLLGSIVDWRLAETGRVEIEAVEEALAFGRVTGEEPGRLVGRNQKVLQVQKRAPPKAPVIYTTETEEDRQAKAETPRLGYFSGALWPGTFSRTRSFVNSTYSTDREGSSTMLGAKAEAQLWFNREIFAEIAGGFGSIKFSQHPLATGSASTSDVSGDLLQLKFAAGYSYLVTGDFFGPKGWVKGGFRSMSYNLPEFADPAEVIGPASFRSFFIGVGGDLPIRQNFGVILNLELGLLTSGSEARAWTTPAEDAKANGTTDLQFYLGGYYRLTHRIVARVGLDVVSNSADFNNGGTLSHRVFTISPAILYYF